MSTPDLAPAFVIKQADGSSKAFYTPTEMGLRYHQSGTPNLLLLGGRGSGKSTIGRNDIHMRCMAHPGFRALVVRNTYPALRRSHLVNIVAEMAALGGYYNKTENCAYYPERDGQVSKCWYGACDDEATINSYLSSEFHLLFLDELVTIPLATFLNLSACVRVPEGSGLTPLVRAASNTLGPHARWVKAWFVDKTVSAQESETYDPADFETITSTVRDNPYIDADAYVKSLGRHGEQTRRSWIDNEWVFEGAYFADFCPQKDGKPWHVIPTLPTVKGLPLTKQPWINVYRAIDWGWSPDPTVCLWVALLSDESAVVIKERTWRQTTASEVAKEIVRESAGLRIVDTFCDASMFRTGRGAEDEYSIGDKFEMNGVPMTPIRNDRAESGYALHDWLNTTLAGGFPKLQIVGPECPMLVQTFPELECDKNDARKIADGPDHWVIALSYVARGILAPSREPEVSTLPMWMRHVKRPGTRLGSESARHRAA